MPLPTRRPLRLLLTAAFWTTAVTAATNDYLIELTPIIGRSMSPTLSPLYHTTGSRDTLLWLKWRPTRDLQRGDIVLYHTPLRAEGSAVKRVIALAGDTVILDPRRRPDGEGVPAERTAARNWDAMAPRVEVPYGHVWVEGDNWRASQDSNHFGMLSKSLIVGRAVGVVWPLGRWGRPWEKDGEGDGGWKGGRTKVVVGRERVPLEWEDLGG